jgi:biopolymer transport protein ExbB
MNLLSHIIDRTGRLALAAVIVAGLSSPGFAQSPASEPAPTAPAAEAAAPAAEAPAAPAADGSVTPPPVAGEIAKEEVLNPYGLQAMLEHGDFVTLGTFAIMVLMSVGTWYILITKLIEQAFLNSQTKAAEANFWNAKSLSEGRDRLKPNSALRAIVEDGLRAAEHHEGTLTEHIDLHSWITMSLQRSVDAINNRMQGGLAFLATVGSTAPFVGLLGTVWGIYNALVAIGVSGQASIDKVAGPVGEALIMTAIGLMVAVPAVLAYNWLARRNKGTMDRVRAFTADLHALLIANQTKAVTSGRSA